MQTSTRLALVKQPFLRPCWSSSDVALISDGYVQLSRPVAVATVAVEQLACPNTPALVYRSDTRKHKRQRNTMMRVYLSYRTITANKKQGKITAWWKMIPHGRFLNTARTRIPRISGARSNACMYVQESGTDQLQPVYNISYSSSK